MATAPVDNRSAVEKRFTHNITLLPVTVSLSALRAMCLEERKAQRPPQTAWLTSIGGPPMADKFAV